jgi:tellurite methyltransferase
MERAMTGFHRDEVGDWVAELSCGHNQHVRHHPPFQSRPWVLEATGRAERIGGRLDCPLCDRAELPDATRLVRASASWDERTTPVGLRQAHRVAPSTWGRIVVERGRLRFSAATTPPLDVLLEQGSTQAIPPEVDHHVEPCGPVSFRIDFYAVDRSGGLGRPGDADGDRQSTRPEDGEDGGGDPACWVHLVCPSCGAFTADGYHRPGCELAGGIG